jgi:hypothetical protein
MHSVYSLPWGESQVVHGYSSSQQENDILNWCDPSWVAGQAAQSNQIISADAKSYKPFINPLKI